ncbi:hypothetical protein AB0M80_03100 [Amycolatopsis sp. NPDC051045]|uniref:hypothetical protein n=1 Tax=Amycolatopsis sp. NPDC051045 TaxID=3156922 RepID=UPI003441EFFC
MSRTTVLALVTTPRPCGGNSNPLCPGCGQATNANGNCFNDACWNANSKRHDGIG